MKNKWAKLTVIAIIIILAAIFYAYDLQQYLTIDFLKTKQDQFQQYYQENRFQTIVGYMLVYIVVTALSLPGAAVLTLAGGALFGVFV
jgi:uncharacterized membrane protein YdjX (TVP38/TMEM64 family)